MDTKCTEVQKNFIGMMTFHIQMILALHQRTHIINIYHPILNKIEFLPQVLASRDPIYPLSFKNWKS
ncbi:MAG: hypothetical protein CL608_14570 [Anaerolineaceae bacterium]|nr:hypothetical protein [Anaerolineaceae bacterium]